MLRLLLIEDNGARISQFREWLPENVVLVVAASAGRAIGTRRLFLTKFLIFAKCGSL